MGIIRYFILLKSESKTRCWEGEKPYFLDKSTIKLSFPHGERPLYNKFSDGKATMGGRAAIQNRYGYSYHSFSGTSRLVNFLSSRCFSTWRDFLCVTMLQKNINSFMRLRSTVKSICSKKSKPLIEMVYLFSFWTYTILIAPNYMVTVIRIG